MKHAQRMLHTYERAWLSDLARPPAKDNRAFAAASLRFWAEAQNTRDKLSHDVEVPRNDALARLAEGYAA